jgi:hypothetical protein
MGSNACGDIAPAYVFRSHTTNNWLNLLTCFVAVGHDDELWVVTAAPDADVMPWKPLTR